MTDRASEGGRELDLEKELSCSVSFTTMCRDIWLQVRD